MKKIILFILAFIYCSTWATYALDSRVEQAYNTFFTSIESKYDIQRQELILESVKERANLLLEQNRFSQTKLSIFNDLEKLNNEKLFEFWLEKETSQSTQEALEERMSPVQSKKKIPFSELSTEFRGAFTKDLQFQEKWGFYYGYNFNSFRYYSDPYGVFEWDLTASNFRRDKDYIYIDENGRYNFITDINESRLIATADVYGLPDKHLVLDALSEDAKYPTSDMSDILWQISAVSKNLSRGKSKLQATEAIYGWILENISYSTNFSLSDERIFSAIETFKNKNGVCTWYTKLMLYMLAFAWIHDVEVIRGQVIDAEDFPEIGHAWIRIGDRYYDPTFDDPIWALDTKKRSEYTYFGLPRDIFYANRFEYADLPESFKTKTNEQIREHIFNYLKILRPKYEWQSEYENVFAPIVFRENYNISPLTNVTPSLLAQKIGSNTIKDDSFIYTKNWKQTQVTWIRYFVITVENTERVLIQLGYAIDEVTLFNWQTSSGAYEWRLAYELEEQ